MILSKTRLFDGQIRLRYQTATQGFALIEVLVAALLTLLLSGVAMQTIVAATAVRVRAQETSESANWIQADLEDIKPIANGEDMGFCPTGSTATGCAGISANFTTDTAKCNATGTGGGYGNDLKELLGASTDINKASEIGARPYLLRRVTEVKNEAPYSILKVTYSVYRGASATGTPMNTFYTEVVPGVSFSCR
jgi:type II secretory pathway pseudopilin PulG